MEGSLVTIVKDGTFVNIDENLLRKDDRVVFQAGEVVPADLKLVEARDLEIDEFDVTGEIMPVRKNVEEDDDTFLYMGSRITKGTGQGFVIATGDKTEYGRVLKQSWEQTKSIEYHFFEGEYLWLVLLLLPALGILIARSKNPWPVIPVFLIVDVLLILLQNYELFQSWILSNEIKKLERDHIQIRDPLALERIHAADTICFDKTGVLTSRKMNVSHVYFGDATATKSNHLDDNKTAQLTKLACALCHDVFIFEKFDLANPIDKALISFAQNNGISLKEALSQYKRIYDQPFDSENRYMASGFEFNGKAIYFAKGDPAVILKMCDVYLTPTGELEKFSLKIWLHFLTAIDAMTQNGGTAIALAYAPGDPQQAPKNFIFLCLLHLENSLQPGVKEMVRRISLEAKRSMLLTGDRDETAARIGVECGITANPRLLLSGKVIERMALDEVARQAEYCSVFARLMPSQKGVVIRLMQQKNHIVAMVGDGPNDGVALKVADISISFVQNSSPIARRLAKILIQDVTDTIKLIEASNRIKNRADEVHSFRALSIGVIMIGMYIWAFSSYSLVR